MSGTSSAAAAGVSAADPGRVYEQVIIHPLVLLSATDHHYRIAKEIARKRVVGVLLGETYKGRVDVTNSFALPFEEDARDPTIFFLDHDYLERMFFMHKKINAKERIVGFYSTSPKLRPSDMQIDALLRASPVGLAHPLCVLIDVRPETEGLPVQAYQSVETIASVAPAATTPAPAAGAAAPAAAATAAAGSTGTEVVRTFVHIPCAVGAYEAEEVGVEHLLRDINDPTLSTMGGDLKHKLSGLRGLSEALGDVSGYLEKVLAGGLPVNHDVLATVQATLSLLPNTHVDAGFGKALAESTNDSHLALYAGSMTRAVLAMHDLVSNKARMNDLEAKEEAAAASATDASVAEGGKEEKKEGADGGKKKAGGDDEKKGGTGKGAGDKS